MSSVWRNRDFVWLVSGQTISEFGSSIGGFAIPWLLLQMTGSALQMGLVFSVGFLPYLFLSLPAGVWADRFDRKRLMMIADAGRMILILSIPVAHMLHVLTILQLYIVLAAMNAFSAVFDAAYVSCLPNIVGKEHLQAGNSAIQAGVSASQILGPPLAGVLIGFLGSTNTITANAVSFAISVVSLLAIRKSFSAQANADAPKRNSMGAEIGEGLRFVWNHRLIRTISLFTMVLNIGSSATNAVLLYRMKHDLHLSAHWAGVVMTGFSAGTIVGSLLSGVIGKRYSMGRIMAVALSGMTFPVFLIAFTQVPVVIMVAGFMEGLCGVVWNVQSITLRQSVIPDQLLGRASSAIRMIAWASIPVGSAIGGATGQWFGAPIVFIGAGVVQLALWVVGMNTPLFRATKPNVVASDVSPGA